MRAETAGAAMVAMAMSLPAGAEQPVELGLVAWQRDFAKAAQEARTSGKPLMALFDEVPGCETCRNFGAGPLSHPIVVDAAREFVAVAVYNNIPGVDADLLKRFSEPAWNNPVVRFMDADGKDILPRKENQFGAAALIKRMVMALEKSQRKVPEYLRLADREYNPSQLETATFAMHCYWEGEQVLGRLRGVVTTRTGMLDRNEVVEVQFDSAALSFSDLLNSARDFNCADRVYVRTDEHLKAAAEKVGNRAIRTHAAIDSSNQQKHHLAQKPEYYYLPLTELQASRLNAELSGNVDVSHYLSPSQIALKERISKGGAELLERLKALTPDRSQQGLPGYARALMEKLSG